MKPVFAMLLLLTAAPAEARRIPVEGKPGATLDDRAGRTVLHLPAGTVPIGRGGPCDPCTLRGARVIGERPGAAIILLVTYASRPGTPGGACGAGEEEVLNIVSLRPRPREASAVLLSSCWSNVEGSDAPVWDKRKELLTAGRWTLESKAEPERLGWHIGRDGSVAEVGIPAAQR